MSKLTKEQIQQREELANKIIDEILNEEGIEELEGLELHERRKHDQHNWYWESDKEFLSNGHNYRGAAILLSIYLRVKARRDGAS